MQSNHATLNAWVAEMAALCKPDAIHWCDGSQAEYDALMKKWGTASSAE